MPDDNQDQHSKRGKEHEPITALHFVPPDRIRVRLDKMAPARPEPTTPLPRQPRTPKKPA